VGSAALSLGLSLGLSRSPRAPSRLSPLARTARFVALAAMVALSAAGSLGCRRNGVEPPQGDVLAELSALTMVDGNVFDPKALYDRDVLVMFFSPSCGHCMREMPDGVAAAEQAGTAVLAVMLNGGNDEAERLAFADRLTAPVLLDDGQIRRKYGIRAVPYTLVLNQGGKAERAFVGAQGQERLATALRDVAD
jgi:thiol-disulfide isomerase/thioredoxin